MDNACKRLAKLAIRKQVKETADPLVALTLRKKEPELQAGIRVSAYAAPDGDRYNAFLVYSSSQQGCSFYKKCIRKGCKSRTAALLVAEYGKNTACINCPLMQNKPNRELNLN
ncbi:MAG TPA: hypothetical protein VJ953_21165 [Saprospiraceae bacterium]|nr:hypothetical protein [Saprospiraceae bacterium]